MKIAVSGSEGFIGSYLVRELRTHLDIEIISMDLINGFDICDWDQIKDVKADIYIHLANKSFVPDSYNSPREFYDVNINSTLNILELARINKAKVIYLSSYVYGHPIYLPIDEKHPVKAFNPYAQTKVICEEMCEGYSRDFYVPIIVFRPFNIFGHSQNDSFLIPTIIKKMIDGKVDIKDIRPKRDYIHVLDVVSAIVHMLEYKPVNNYEVYNLGSGISYSVSEVIETISRCMNKDIPVESLNEFRPNEILDTVAEMTKLKDTGWNLKYTFEEGINLMIKDR